MYQNCVFVQYVMTLLNTFRLRSRQTYTHANVRCLTAALSRNPNVCMNRRGQGTLQEDNRGIWEKRSGCKANRERRSFFFSSSFGRRVVAWLFEGDCMLGWPRAINRRLSQPSAASLIYRAPPIAPGFIWPLSNTCSITEFSPALAGPLCILNNPDGNCPFLKC